jgi:hypothetical protein
VKDAALARGHRRERVRLAGSANPLNGHLGHKIELAIAGSLEAIGVERDAVVIFRFEAENLGGNVFDGKEKLSVAGEKERSVGTGQLDSDFGIGRGRRGGRLI